MKLYPCPHDRELTTGELNRIIAEAMPTLPFEPDTPGDEWKTSE